MIAPMRRLLLLILLLAGPLAANDIAVSTPDGRGVWLLLEPPTGQAGPGWGEFAGDPGLPAPDVLGRPAASRQLTDLWLFESATGSYQRVTQVSLPNAALYAVFEAGGEPYVLLNQPGAAPTSIVRARDLRTPGAVLAPASVALALSEFADAPVVSPDGRWLALRVFRGREVLVRVVSTTNWKTRAESTAANFSRPVWINNQSLACLAFDNGVPRVALRDTSVGFVRANDTPAPLPGRLLRLDVQDNTLTTTELLKGEFPPETFTRALARDFWTQDLILARKSGTGVVMEQRAATANATPTEIATFEHARGISVGPWAVSCVGVRQGLLWAASLVRRGKIELPLSPLQPRHRWRFSLAFGGNRFVDEYPLANYSSSGLGGLVDVRRGKFAILEPAANPDALDEKGKPRDSQPLCLHTLVAPPFRGCDSMRNPRNLARLSGLVKRFAELDDLYPAGIPSTQLAFDMRVSLAGADPKKGTYVELYHADGRGGKGRIRTEDNLSGDWLMNSIDGAGSADTDWVYTCAAIKTGTIDKKQPARAGKLYDDMVTQLEARKLLLLGGVAKAAESGGLRYLGRGVHKDLASGLEMRIWAYEKLGRLLADGQRERVVLRFVAELPVGARGTWACPHGLAHANLQFALANGQDAAVTELYFAPDQFVSLPNLTNKSDPDLILPREFRIYERDAAGKYVERLTAKAQGPAIGHGAEPFEIAHPAELVSNAKLRPGYYVPSLCLPAGKLGLRVRQEGDKLFQELLRPGLK